MPPYGNFTGRDKGYDAEAALTKYRAVKAGATAEGVAPIAANTDKALGVALFGVTSAEILRGKGATVREAGIVEWEAGAAIAKDAAVTIDAAGRCVTAATTNRVYGRTRQAAALSGDVIAVAVNFDNTPILA
jgi:hypothetical protein